MERVAMMSAVAVVLALVSPVAAQQRPDQPAAVPQASPDQPGPDQQLAAVRELVMYANYRAALPAVRAVLERTDLTAQQRSSGLELLAIVDLALRDERGAREALAQLYSRDPGHRLSDPDASPVVQSAFARAREGARAVSVTIEHTPPVLDRRVAPQVRARLAEGGDAVHDIRLAYRQGGASRWTFVQLGVEAGEATGRIPVLSDEDAGFTIEYYLEARAPSSTVLASTGSPEAPLVIQVPAVAAQVAVVAPPLEEGPAPAPAGGDVAGEAWLWVLIGVVVVGAGVGTGVGIALGSEGPQDGSLGNVTLPLAAF